MGSVVERPIVRDHRSPMPIYAPVDLRCESITDPIGLDVVEPRLSWRMRDDRRGARQTAYRVIATDADAAVSTVPLWDSGKIDGDRSAHVVYAGPALTSRRRIRWRVRVWNADGIESPWSAAATIEMGLLDRADWQGGWIGGADVGGPWTSPPCPYLRRTFTTIEKPIRARLYVTALGLFEAEINGARVGADVLAPGRTEYSKRVPHHVYDVTERIVEGANAIGVILGDGWYSGHVGTDPRMVNGDRPRLLAQLELFYADGRAETIATDGTWRYTTNGPIRSSDLLMGEDYDARRELGAWSAAGYDDAGWREVETSASPEIEIVARRSPPIRQIHEVVPIMAPTRRERAWIFDLGQNMVGRCRLRLRDGARGPTVTLRHAEMLDADGSLHTANLRGARATDTYTCRGDAEELYEPRFTFHGFRYVEVAGLDAADVGTITGVVLHGDGVEVSAFECSSPTLNQLHRDRGSSEMSDVFDALPDEASDAQAVIDSWTTYLRDGDARQLADRYPTMQRSVASLGSIDARPPDADAPTDLIDVASAAHAADLMAKVAAVLGKLDDVQAYRTLGDDVRAAWQRRFVTPAGLIVGETQTAYALALHFRLVPFPLRGRVLATLVRDVETRGVQPTTGVVGTPLLLQALTEGGRLDVAYAVLETAARSGATATSQFGDWINATIAGIDVDPSRPAYKHAILAPRPGGGLTFARGSIATIFGRLATEWTLDGVALTLDVTIPPNTTATIHVPATSAEVVREGDAPASESSDLAFVAHRDGTAIYEAVAGTYRFTSTV